MTGTTWARRADAVLVLTLLWTVAFIAAASCEGHRDPPPATGPGHLPGVRPRGGLGPPLRPWHRRVRGRRVTTRDYWLACGIVAGVWLASSVVSFYYLMKWSNQ